jgi:hypothetical protein
MIESFHVKKEIKPEIMEVLQPCSEVYPKLYCIMPSAPVPDLERTKKLQNKW